MHEWRVSRAALQCLSRDLPTHRLLWTVKGPSFPKYGYFNRKSHTAGAIESLIFQARQLIADAPGGIINDWQDKRILYARAEISLLFGKILLKCTLGQAFLAKLAYFVRFLLEKAVRGYISRISCQKVAFWLRRGTKYAFFAAHRQTHSFAPIQRIAAEPFCRQPHMHSPIESQRDLGAT